MARRPHPIPYQGSKRRLADRILACLPTDVGTLLEPFAGSGAITLAAAVTSSAQRFHLNDSLLPLAGIWRSVVASPSELADAYEALWEAQRPDPRAHYLRVRRAFNEEGEPAKLLYLLARCVKGAIRFNGAGGFNQSADNRRLGRAPARMRSDLAAAHAALVGRTEVTGTDYAEVLARATPADVVYMDPPYQGTSGDRDPRYHEGLDLTRFIEELARLRSRGVPFLVSFDGRTGDKAYGEALPASLGLTRLELPAGRSTQATLLGRSAETVESLYLSPGLT
jgi:DNA adenine methylase